MNAKDLIVSETISVRVCSALSTGRNEVHVSASRMIDGMMHTFVTAVDPSDPVSSIGKAVDDAIDQMFRKNG